jgi:hypothetical protein
MENNPASYKDSIDNMQVIPLHFNVIEHSLPLEEFIIAAKSTEAIIEDFNNQFFAGKLTYQIIVLPPAAGTFKERLGLKVTTAAAIFILGGVTPEFASGVVKGITGKSVGELGEIVGGSIVETVKDGHELWQSSLVTIFLAEAVKGFFQLEEKDLKKCGVTKEKFMKAYEGRNDFYEACYRNQEIKSVGFDETDNFPIRRTDFARFIVKLPEKDEDDDDLDWKVEITYIKVTSPNWERGDNRLWKAKYNKDNEALFTIEDDAFWKFVDAEKLSVKVKDSIKVQWAYVVEAGRRRKFKVLRVLEYNGIAISKPLSDEELDTVLQRHSKVTKRQADLFDGTS